MDLAYSRNPRSASSKTDRPGDKNIAIGMEIMDKIAMKKAVGRIKVKVQRINGLTIRAERETDKKNARQP